MKGILGKKLGMTQVFTEDGVQIPVTVVEVTPNVVTQIKTEDKDGYNAVQVAVSDKRVKNTSKSLQGHFDKANTAPKRFVKEFRDFEGADELSVGQELPNIFEVGEIIDVQGISKGKGFQGAIKRHNQRRGPMSHGSRFHRAPGAMGNVQDRRVRKGKLLPGHMGDALTTIQNSQIVAFDAEKSLVLVKGNVPGSNNTFVTLKKSVKTPGKIQEIKVLNFNDAALVGSKNESAEEAGNEE